jgi:hypothetical protein
VNPLESTLTRWRDRQTGELLVAVALKRDEVTSVLPIRDGVVAHPLDWMPEGAFLESFEVAA